MLTGLAFLVLGAAGLVPGVTTDGQLFGVFAVSGALTLLHLLTGAIAVFCTRSAALSRRFLVAAGLLYAALGVYGLLPVPARFLEYVPMNLAGICLAFGVSALMFTLALVARKKRVGRAS